MLENLGEHSSSVTLEHLYVSKSPLGNRVVSEGRKVELVNLSPPASTATELDGRDW